MRVALVGPELEENLGLRYLHASLTRAGHEARIFDFHGREQIPGLVEVIRGYRPDVVGLSMVFTGRARQYLDLARQLRPCGHVTAGGHFASFHADELLDELDSVVHGDGEEVLVDLVEHLEDLEAVRGLSFRRDDEKVHNERRANPDDLDARPWPTRPGRLHEYMGIPIANMLGSRGCHGNCNYCSVYAWFRESGGKRLRQRTVEDVAAEVSWLHRERGARIFNFHDDNFLVASKKTNLERFRALGDALSGLGRIALQIKARPDAVDGGTFELLREMGLFRVFLGVESNAMSGLRTLGRRTHTEQNHAALRILRRMGVHTSFNLLVFDPETVLADLAENIAFMRRYADMPLNFGRVEVYTGTPLERTLRTQGRLLGDHFGYTYRIRDARAQRAFEMYKRVFIPRAFDVHGLNLRAMKLDYFFHLLRHFHPGRASSALERRVRAGIREVNLSSADLMERICAFVGSGTLPSGEQCRSMARALAAERESLDERLSVRMDHVMGEVLELGAGRRPRSRYVVQVAATAASAVLVLGVAGCRTKGQPDVEKPLPAPPGKIVKEQPSPEPPPEPPAPEPLTQEQLDAIKEKIAERYQEALNEIVSKYGYRDKVITLELVLDGGGEVSEVEISVPTSVQVKEFEKDLRTLVEGWQFAGQGHEVQATVTVQYVEPPKPPPKRPPKDKPKQPKPKQPEWHMCEMMMMPLEDLED